MKAIVERFYEAARPFSNHCRIIRTVVNLYSLASPNQTCPSDNPFISCSRVFRVTTRHPNGSKRTSEHCQLPLMCCASDLGRISHELTMFKSCLSTLSRRGRPWVNTDTSIFKARNLPVCLSVCLPVCGLHISRTLHLIGYTLGMCIVKGPREQSVEFGPIWTSDTFNNIKLWMNVTALQAFTEYNQTLFFDVICSTL